MLKSIWFRALVVTTVLSVSAVCTYTYAQGLLKKSDNIPSIHTTKTFLIYAKKGTSKSFNFYGKLIENKEAKDFQNGDVQVQHFSVMSLRLISQHNERMQGRLLLGPYASYTLSLMMTS